jgi:hypothetical protein
MVIFNPMIARSIQPPSLAARSSQLLICAFVLIFGALLGVSHFWDSFIDMPHLGWQRVPCTIVSSAYRRGFDRRYTADIRYAYTVNGKAFTADQMRHPLKSIDDIEPIQQALLRYPTGSAAHCFVDPKNPTDAMLGNTSPSAGSWSLLLIPILLSSLGVIGIVDATRPSSGGKRSREKRFPSVILAVIFCFGIAGVMSAARTRSRMAASKQWPGVTATVVDSGVFVYQGRGKSYRADILYRYHFGGAEYLSNRYEMFDYTSSRSDADALAAQFPPGKQVVAYVDPARPTYAVLVRGYTWRLAVIVIPLICLAVGGGGLVVRLLQLKGRGGTIRPSLR